MAMISFCAIERWMAQCSSTKAHGILSGLRPNDIGGAMTLELADSDMIRSLYRNLCVTGCLAAAVSLTLIADLSAQTPAAAENTAAAPAPAQTAKAEAAAPVGSAERGKSLTYTCQGCHGVTGYKNVYPTYYVPKIAGQSNEYLLAALKGYKQGTRKHPTMQAQAQSFSDQDLADIAAYLTSLKKK
jgi:cytochrome c553